MTRESTRDEIVLIGPVRAGKSTVAQLLAERLGVERVSLDPLRYGYYKEIGFDEEYARDLRKASGFEALVMYRYLFDAYAVERVLAEYSACVFDFGGAIYESDESLRRVQQALKPYRNVILLLPSPDLEESLAILRARDDEPPKDLKIDLLRRLVMHPSYYRLAKLTVYNKNQTPEETCEEIIRRVKIPS